MMKLSRRIIVGSRRSKLALCQSRLIVDELRRVYPDLEFEVLEITTTGDRDGKAALEALGGKGVFVKELEESLLCGRADLAVHSLKDMPTEIPDGLCLAAVSERADPRDVLVSRWGKVADLPPGAVVGTTSQRRAVQIRALRADLKVRDLVGNVDTRLRKVLSGEFDGALLAAAALIRLGVEDWPGEPLAAESFVPAVGQGALGIEIRSGDARMVELLSAVNHQPSWQAVVAERAFLLALGGGCRAPIAALGKVSGGVLHLRGMVADPASGRIISTEIEGNAFAPAEVGNRLARKVVELGGMSLIERAGA